MGAHVLIPRPGGAWRWALTVLAVSACLTPTDPNAGRVAELRLRAAFAPGTDPDAMGVTVDTATVVAAPSDGGPAPVDTAVALDDLEAVLSWIVDLDADSAPYTVQLQLRGGGQRLYAGDDEIQLTHLPLGDAPVHDVAVSYVGPGTVATVTVTPGTATLTAIGTSRPFTAEARDADGILLAPTFTWSSDDESVATIDPGTGEAVAVATGTATITATAVGVAGTATLTVAPGGLFVEITPASATIPALNATRQFAATARDGDGVEITGATFAWSSGNTAVATVDGAGLVTAVAEGSTVVTAETGGVSATADLLVAVVTTIEVTPATVTLDALGATLAFTAVARDGNGDPVPGVTFTWSSSEPAVATVDAQSGIATALANGTTDITAAAGDAAGSASLDVAQAIASFTVTPATATLTALGATQQFTAEARDANDSTVAVNTAWSSADDAIATVDPGTGLATAVSTGDVTITATAGGGTATAQLIVAPGGLTVEVSPNAATITALGTTRQFTAVARDGDGTALTGAAITWIARDPSVVGVNGSGLATAVGEGTAYVVATLGDAADSAEVLVAVATTIEVTPATATLEAFGATQPFGATARDADGMAIPGATFTWTSSDAGVAPVDPSTGVATAVENGTVTITAASGNATGTAGLTVTQAVAGIAVTPGSATLTAFGATQQFAATPLDANANPVTRPVTVTWAVTDSAVGMVDGVSGLVTALGNGTAGIVATAEGAIGGASLTVDQVVTAVDVTPATAMLTTIGATQAFAATARDANGYAVADAAFTWESSNPAVATVDAASGLATAVAPGSVTISATADGVTGTATLGVDSGVDLSRTTITADPLEVEANNDDPSAITVRLFDADGSPLGASGGAVELFSTLGELTAPVTDNGDGTYSAQLRSAVSGTAVVTGTLDGQPIPDDAEVRFSTDADRATITADPVEVEANNDNPSIITVRLFNAGGTPRTTSGGTVTLATTLGNLTGVADLGNGTYRAELRSGVPGTAIVTGWLNGVPIADSAEVLFVDPNQVTTVDVTPVEATIGALGGTQQYTAVARNYYGNVLAGVAFAWSSGDETVATVDPVTGLATAVANGTTTITATAGGVSGSASVTVAQVVTSVTVTPADVTLTAVGETVQLTAAARDANDAVVPDAVFTWTTSDASLVTVADTGLATAVAHGLATIQATTSDVSGSAVVAVCLAWGSAGGSARSTSSTDC